MDKDFPAFITAVTVQDMVAGRQMGYRLSSGKVSDDMVQQFNWKFVKHAPKTSTPPISDNLLLQQKVHSVLTRKDNNMAASEILRFVVLKRRKLSLVALSNASGNLGMSHDQLYSSNSKNSFIHDIYYFHAFRVDYEGSNIALTFASSSCCGGAMASYS